MKSFLARVLGWTSRAASRSARFGGYDVIRVVHEGEKATVYQARSSGDDDLYAIKVYRPLYNRTARRICRRYRLRTEGEIGMLLNPPQGQASEEYPIVRTVLYGKEFNDPGRCYYLVQEYVDGVNAKHLVGCDDPLLRRYRLGMARSLARALAIIHKRGLVHRDICTDNILLPKSGYAKLIDLGFMVPEGICFQERTGTPSYMSPEQIQVKPLHAAADLYAFGVVLYELFTRRLPFESGFRADKREVQMRRASELMDKHLHDTPPPPSAFAKDLPKGLEPIVMRCLEKTPADRYANVGELLVALANVDDPVAETPEAETNG